MTFLPIVERELRVASRRSATYWGRVHMAMGALIPTFFLLWEPFGRTGPGQRGAQIFGILSTISLFVVVMSAVRWTADCISSEKREGTLGFLFLTDLKPRDVLLGKLSAGSLAALYSLLAFVPMLTIPVLIGGVTLADVLRLAVVLVNTLLFALSLSVLISTLCWRERQATSLSMMSLIGFALGVPMLLGIANSISGPMPWLDVLLLASPAYTAGLISGTSFSAAGSKFWISIGLTHAMSWGFFGLACFSLPRVWQDRPSEGFRQRWKERCRAWLLGRTETRRTFRRALLNVNPIYWFASRERLVMWYPWLFLGSMGALLVLVCWTMKIRGVDFWPLLWLSFGLNWFFKHWIAGTAAGAFSADRDKGALELLLSTSLWEPDFLAGHALAMRRQFLAPVATVLVLEAVGLVLAIATDRNEDEKWLPCGAMAVVMVVFALDVMALTWAGWWFGVVSKNASTAVNTAYFRVMLPPWVLAMGALVPTVFLAPRFLTDFGHWIFLVVWACSSVVIDVLMVRYARHKLLTELRLAAVERFSGGDAAMIWWRRLGRSAGRWVAGLKSKAPVVQHRPPMP